jgi:type II secretory pathway pseudopilin PulG
MRQKGFTLVEMIIIIVALGILLPTIFLPFISASKGVATPTSASGLVAVARKVMDEELTRVDLAVWPAATACATTSFYCTGWTAPLTAPASVTLNGNTYSSVITEKFCDGSTATNPLTPATCVNTSAAVGFNNYLVINVTTTSSTGGTVTFQTIKTYGY